MSTPESLKADEERDRVWLEKIYDGGWVCDCGCGNIYDVDEEDVIINGNRYALQCLKDEYGLVKE